MRAPFSPDDLRDVRKVLVGNTMTTIDQFMMDLDTAGFVQVRATDLTDDTRTFAAARLAAWQKDSVTHKNQYGVAAYAAMETFYATVSRLFEKGSLGCTRLVAKRE